jgi:alkylation response protein AidB-like acyl-CoA dehydrogenase
MNLEFSKEDTHFREEVRSWLNDNKPHEPHPSFADLRACRDYDTEWQAHLYQSGWAGISWPKEYGGQGLSLTRQLIWYEEYSRAEMPPAGVESVCFVALAHAGPTLIYNGTEAQKREHLNAILRGRSVWCQGFSEPAAGSDLASLRTRAVLEDNQLVVNGQKVWTSRADVSDYQELLVRTGTQEERHKGLTWVICDMRTPGITINPIRNMSGTEEFCEVFYDDVRIPLDNVVGGLNNGWKTAMSTLSFERGSAFIADQVQLDNEIQALQAIARKHVMSDGRRAIYHDDIARRLRDLQSECNALRAMTYMDVSRNAQQALPGPEGSMTRLFFSKLCQRVGQLLMDLLEGESLRRSGSYAPAIEHYLYQYASTIGAGTEQIQRSIIAERILGMPKSR